MFRKDCDSRIQNVGTPWRRIVLTVAAACAVGSMTQPTLGAAVRMWSTSVVDGEKILVGDVAEVLQSVPDQARRYGAVAIKPAPTPGNEMVVTLDELREALVGAGANPVEFTVCGSVICRVVRPLTLRVSNEDATGQARYWWPGRSKTDSQFGRQATNYQVSRPDNDEITVQADHIDTSGMTLEDILHANVAKRFGDLGGRVHVRFSANARKALSLAGPEYDFRIHWSRERKLGRCGLTVDILRDGRVEQDLPLVLEVSLTLPVVVACRPINRGQAVRTQDVRVEDRDFYNLSRIGLMEAAEAVGQQTRRFIRRGEMVYHNDLKSMPLVTRGQMITVWSQVGGLRVKSVAKALESGAFGETIEVRNETSRDRYQVTVTGPQAGRIPEISRRMTAMHAEGGK